ncbi:hypothetical protein STCU_07086 [Strigomonas culicis]|uniref:A-kinase anchor protein 7-like phosphoesterase domain-containing protein n=1 Tax=Strigomonas culicis TaxID=28005 RepID=S9VCC8_9TRYP|nr:hypothetical protein STCU_07086 [Strigomonas culicis]|eukprot:EPY24626.1 hypothetical protein STCU_07086 [Strigomonas culicis]
MADLIAPPSAANNVPMTKEQAELVRREKQQDNDTRKALEAYYGGGRQHQRAVQLTRRKAPPAGRGGARRHGADTGSWVCPQCRKTSNDIRHVCAFCLAPEPAYIQQIRAPRGNKSGKAGASAAAAPCVLDRQAVVNCDPGARICTTALTQRHYRLIQEPVVDAQPLGQARKDRGKAPAAGHRQADGAEAEEEEESEAGDDDRAPGAGRGHVGAAAPSSAVYEDEPPCRPQAHTTETPPPDDAAEAGRQAPAPLERKRPATDLAPSRYTHFLSLPIGKIAPTGTDRNTVQADGAQLLQDMRDFIAEANAADGGDGPEAGDRSGKKSGRLTTDLVEAHTGRLHLTLLLLTLNTNEDVQFAKDLLTEVFAARWAQDPARRGDGLRVALQQLHVMPSRDQQERFYKAQAQRELTAERPVAYPEGNAAKASVVFMGVKDAGSLDRIHHLQDLLFETYQELLDTAPAAATADRAATPSPASAPREERNLLHLTLLNKKWRKENKHRNQTFDATALLQKFKDRALNVQDGNSGGQPFAVDTIELCRMSSDHHHSKNGPMYVVEAAIPL